MPTFPKSNPMKSKAKRLRKKAVKVTDPRKGLIKKADALWSKIIRSQPGPCEYCGKWHKVYQAHHIFSRGRWNVRYVLMNGIKLGQGCHRRIHQEASMAFAEWVMEKLGDKYTRLKLLSQGHFKKTVSNLQMIYDQLKQIDEQLNKGE